MHIAIDARWIFREISGIGNYTRELVRELVRLDRSNRYTLIFNDQRVMDRTAGETAFETATNFRGILVPYGLFSPFNQLALPRKLRQEHVDVFHSPNYMIPLFLFPRHRPGKIRCLVTIHDVIPLVMREQVARSRKARLFPVYQWLMKEVAARADAIVAVSQTAADDIRRHLNIREEEAGKVVTIYNGVSARFRPARSGAFHRGSDSTLPAQILYVGRADPYKNLQVLIRAFERLRQNCARPTRLVIAGARDPRYPEPERLSACLGLDNAIRWTGYVSDEQLVTLYQESAVLVHPSRCEGFGLQVLEAMACGTPVICSNIAVLREVAGDAALFVNPDDVEGLARAIQRVIIDPELARCLSEKGVQRAMLFSWEKAAREMLKVYEWVFNLSAGAVVSTCRNNRMG
ncbi:MAG: glycosyltransferase family 4 protein [Kiritimatiellae bacterium]|nr:glycosyltransferase family 4 protein [Kiritimatiellia bacterium]